MAGNDGIAGHAVFVKPKGSVDDFQIRCAHRHMSDANQGFAGFDVRDAQLFQGRLLGACEECSAGNFIGCPERTELGILRRNGAYAEYVAVPARFVHKLPKTMDLRKAALCEPLAVVLKGMRRLKPSLGSNPRQCLVIGAGPLGRL